MKVRKPGRYQMAILECMEDTGSWPQGWRMSYAQRESLTGMETGGLVENRDGTWHLTDLGRQALNDRPHPTTPFIDRRRKDWSR